MLPPEDAERLELRRRPLLRRLRMPPLERRAGALAACTTTISDPARVVLVRVAARRAISTHYADSDSVNS
jgi:hypothetical protein